MDAHELAVGALRAVETMMSMQLTRLARWIDDGVHQGASTRTINPARSAHVTLLRLNQDLRVQLQRSIERAGRFRDENFETDHELF